jgi:hypothetical protein
MSWQLPWFVARAGGIVAWALTAGSVIWGLLLSTRPLGRRPRPAWLFDLHRFLGGLAVIFTAVHVLAVALAIGLVTLLFALRVWQASLPRPAPAGARQRDVSAV